MADISVEKKTGGDLTWVWAVAAIIAIVSLMAWLFSTQDQAQVVTTESVAETAAVAAVDTVDLATLNATPEEYYGDSVVVPSATVAASLGSRAFWADVPGQNPFLVVVDPAVADIAWIQPGETGRLEGSVQPVSETLLDQWVQTGAMHPDARSQAAFVTHYFQATGGGR